MAVVRSHLFAGLTPDTRAPNLLVGKNVEIHRSAQIGANVVIYDDVTIGAEAVIKHNCVIGESPTLALDSRALPQPVRTTSIGDGTMICNAVVICAGAQIGCHVIIGDQSFVREGTDIAADTMIGRGCSVGAGASIGSGVKVQNNSIIMPGMTIEDDVSIGAMLSGATDHSIGRDPALAQQAVTVRRGARIGSSVCLMPGIEVGEEAFIGAGAVVLESVLPREKVAGVPARTIGIVADEDLL